MSKKKKPFKSFTATSKDMEAAMEALVQSDKYILITEYSGEIDGKNGLHNAIHNEWGSPAEISYELKTWAYVMDDKAAHQEQLKDILGESGIDEF